MAWKYTSVISTSAVYLGIQAEQGQLQEAWLRGFGSAAIMASETTRREGRLGDLLTCTHLAYALLSNNNLFPLDICKGLLTLPPQDTGDSNETVLLPLQAAGKGSQA